MSKTWNACTARNLRAVDDHHTTQRFCVDIKSRTLTPARELCRQTGPRLTRHVPTAPFSSPVIICISYLHSKLYVAMRISIVSFLLPTRKSSPSFAFSDSFSDKNKHCFVGEEPAVRLFPKLTKFRPLVMRTSRLQPCRCYRERDIDRGSAVSVVRPLIAQVASNSKPYRLDDPPPVLAEVPLPLRLFQFGAFVSQHNDIKSLGTRNITNE